MERVIVLVNRIFSVVGCHFGYRLTKALNRKFGNSKKGEKKYID